jgi:predicted DNA-binding transcriptional regulator YafY
MHAWLVAAWFFSITRVRQNLSHEGKNLLNFFASVGQVPEALLDVTSLSQENAVYGEQMVRMLRAVDLLSTPAGATKQDLADHLGVDKRTVERLLGLLQELNFPVYDKQNGLSRKKRWRMVDTYVMKLPNITLPNIRLTLPELISLYLMKGEAQLFHGTEIEKMADSAFGKLAFFMPEGLSQQLEKIRTLFVPSSKFTKDYKGKEKIIDGLRRGMVEQKRCAVKYHSFLSGKERDYKLDPLKFFENNGGLYVFAYITGYDEIRTLAVERIERLEVTETPFEYPKDFDPEKLLCSAFGIIFDKPIQVKIKFSKEVSPYIRERSWAPNQQIIENELDGSITLEMETGGWFDVKKWVLSHGIQAEVLEPKEMREEIATELKRCFGKYVSCQPTLVS